MLHVHSDAIQAAPVEAISDKAVSPPIDILDGNVHSSAIGLWRLGRIVKHPTSVKKSVPYVRRQRYFMSTDSVKKYNSEMDAGLRTIVSKWDSTEYVYRSSCESCLSLL